VETLGGSEACAMPDIKPIETVYGGYRFRSRLEARYAVFFDRLEIKYNFEHQGFQLNSGLYLPDFWLPDFDMFFEIKNETQFVKLISPGGFRRHDLPRDQTLARELSVMTSRPVQIAYGDPLCELSRNDPVFFGNYKDCCRVLIDDVRWDSAISVVAALARQARFEHGERF
jgi:hypothetical protein